MATSNVILSSSGSSSELFGTAVPLSISGLYYRKEGNLCILYGSLTYTNSLDFTVSDLPRPTDNVSFPVGDVEHNLLFNASISANSNVISIGQKSICAPLNNNISANAVLSFSVAYLCQ